MELRTLAQTSTKEIAMVFNHAFADYFIPFTLSEAQLRSKMKADKTDLSLSVGVFESGRLVAFFLHGFDIIDTNKILYNGGTGVIPEHRGAGLTRQMYQYLLPILAERGIHKIILEVIRENYPAISSYKKSGFVTKRELLCYKGEVVVPKTNKHLKIQTLSEYPWQRMESFWDVSPTWQNSSRVVADLRDSTIALGAYLDEQLVGYVIYTPSSKRIPQLAVAKKFRRMGIASTLLSELIEQHGDLLSIINVDKTALCANHFLNRMGLVKDLEQLEMEFLLS